jgi:uncharacterized membrane protein
MSADPVSAGPRDDLPGVDRLLALSDGVVAIAITLLVLQLNVPSRPSSPTPTRLLSSLPSSEMALTSWSAT